MKIEIQNGSVRVRNSSDHTPRCFDVSTHVCGRVVTSSASHVPARDKSHENGARAAYIILNVKADELDHEVPNEERSSYRRPSTEQSTFLDIVDARALRDALNLALDCADVK